MPAVEQGEADLAALFTVLFPQLPALGTLAESPLHSEYAGGKGVYAYYCYTLPKKGRLSQIG